MKKNKNWWNWIPTLGLLLCSFATFAQPEPDAPTPARTRVKWGETYNLKPNTEISKIVMGENGGFYVLRTKPASQFRLGGGGSGKIVMEYYDQSMKLKKSRELELEFKGKDRNFKDVIATRDGNMYLLTYFYNSKLKITYLFSQKIDNEKLTVAPDVTKIGEQEGKNVEKIDLFGYTLSPDSSKLLVYSRPIEEERDNIKTVKEEYSISVFNPDLSVDWEKILTLPYPNDRFSIEEMQVDNVGNVFTLGIIFQGGKLKRGGKPTYQYDLVYFLKGSDKPREVKLGDLNAAEFITDLTFRPTASGDIVLAGFYSNKGTFSTKGTCYFRFNPTTEQISVAEKSTFSLDFITANMSNRQKERAQRAAKNTDTNDDAELYDYRIDDIVIKDNGQVVLVAEQYFLEERLQNNNWNNGFNSWNGGMGRGWGGGYDPYWQSRNNVQRDFIFHYNDIIVVQLDTDGKQVWATQIPKSQATVNDNGWLSSFVMGRSGDQLHFVFNDNAKNYDKKKKKEMRYQLSNRSDAVVAMATVDASGTVTFKPLFTDETAGVNTRPRICRQVNAKQIAIYGEDSNEYRFGLVTF